MARQRIIKPEFWTSEQLVTCSRDARLLFIGLLNFCDDAGIIPASIYRIKGQIFPFENFSLSDIQHLIDELIQRELLYLYTIKNEKFLFIFQFNKHQKVRHPTYTFPAPPQEVLDNFCSDHYRNYIFNYRNPTVTLPQPYGKPPERSGPREEKLRDLNMFLGEERGSAEGENLGENKTPETASDDAVTQASRDIDSEISKEFGGRSHDNPPPSTLPCPDLPNADGAGILGAKKTTKKHKKNNEKSPKKKRKQKNDEEIENDKKMKNDVHILFNYWKTVMDYPNEEFSDSRKRLLLKRLKERPLDQLKMAIDFCKKSKWHQGENPNGAFYNGIKHIFEKDDKLASWIATQIKTRKSSHVKTEAEKTEEKLLYNDKNKNDLMITHLTNTVKLKGFITKKTIKEYAEKNSLNFNDSDIDAFYENFKDAITAEECLIYNISATRSYYSKTLQGLSKAQKNEFTKAEIEKIIRIFDLPLDISELGKICNNDFTQLYKGE